MAMNLYEEAQKRIIITAHRGASGGNVPCNTIVAYDAALAHGADMIEVDANMATLNPSQAKAVQAQISQAATRSHL